jgi:hypothetical protein
MPMPMPKPIKPLRAAEPVSPDAKGQWLVLIGDSGETSADDIEVRISPIADTRFTLMADTVSR